MNIETLYNPHRPPQALGYLSPDQFEADHAPVIAAYTTPRPRRCPKVLDNRKAHAATD